MMSRRAVVARAGALGIALAGLGCARDATTYAHDAARARARDAAAAVTPAPYTIQPGDALSIRFALNPDLDSQLPVRPDGRFSLPLVGEVDAAGSTPVELRERLQASYARFLKQPEVTVNVVTFASSVAYIGGEVRNPGVLALTVPTTALRAIFAVGGGLDSGDLRKVVILRDRGTSDPEIMMVDLSRGLETLECPEDVRLRPRDMVFVPRTGISKLGQFVREYIRNILPIESSFSVQYNFSKIAGLN